MTSGDYIVTGAGGSGGGGGGGRGAIGRQNTRIRELRARTRDQGLTARQRAGARRSLRSAQDRLAAIRAARAGG